MLVGSGVAHLAAVGLALSAAGARAGPAAIVDLVADSGAETPRPVRPPPRSAPARPAPMPAVRSAAARPAAAPDVQPRAPGPLVEAPEPVSPPLPPPETRPPAGPVERRPPAVAAAPTADPAPPAPAPQGEAAEVTSEVTAARSAAAGGAVAGRPAAGSARSALGALTAAPATSEAAGGGVLALAPPGDGRGGVPAEYGPYLAHFRGRVQEGLVYPLSARRRGLMGTVELEVLIEPAGQVGSVRVIASSSHAVLDEAALEAVRSLPPLPLPANLPRRSLRVRLPLSFELR